MAKRTDPIKTIAVSLPTYNRLMGKKVYHETIEGVLLKLLDESDKLQQITNPPRSKDGKYKIRR